MAKYLELDGWYKCPDCEASVQGYEIKHPCKEGLYMCPECGCVQEPKEVERQLGKED